jgi:hypothetical protein
LSCANCWQRSDEEAVLLRLHLIADGNRLPALTKIGALGCRHPMDHFHLFGRPSRFQLDKLAGAALLSIETSRSRLNVWESNALLKNAAIAVAILS